MVRLKRLKTTVKRKISQMDKNKVKKSMKFNRKSKDRTANKQKEEFRLKLAVKSGCNEGGSSAKSTELVKPPEAHGESLRGTYLLADRFTTPELFKCASSLKNPASQYQVRNDVREKGRATKKGNARRQRHPSKYSERKPLATTTSEGCNKASCNTGQIEQSLVNNQPAEIPPTSSPKLLVEKKEQHDVVNATVAAPKIKRDRRSRFQVAKALDKQTTPDRTIRATVEAESPEMGRKPSKTQNVSDYVYTQNKKCSFRKNPGYTNDRMEVDLPDNVKIRKRKYNSIIIRPVPVCGEEIPFNSESVECSFEEEQPVLAKKLNVEFDCNVPYPICDDSGAFPTTQTEVNPFSSPCNSCNISDKQQSPTPSYLVGESQESCVQALQYLMTQSPQQFLDCTIIFNCAALHPNSRKEDSAPGIIEVPNKKDHFFEHMKKKKNPNLHKNNEMSEGQNILQHVLQLEALNNKSLTLPHVPQHEATQIVSEDESERMSEGEGKGTVNGTAGSNIHSLNSKIVSDISKSTQTDFSYDQYPQSSECQESVVCNNNGNVTQPEMQEQAGIHPNEGTSGMSQLLESRWGCIQNLAKKLTAITSRIKLISREASRMQIFSSLFYVPPDDKGCDTTKSSSAINNGDGHCSMDSSNPSPPQIYGSASMESLAFNAQFKHPNVQFNISERNLAINSNRNSLANLQEQPQYLRKVTTNDVVSKGTPTRTVKNAWDITGYKQYVANCRDRKRKLKSTSQQCDRFRFAAQGPSSSDSSPDARGSASNYEYARTRQTCKSCMYDQLVFRAMHSNCAPFNVGDFVVNFADLVQAHPPIWQVSPSKVLLKYVPFDYKGKIRYRSVSIYSALNAEKLETHVKVPVEVCFKFGRREIVEILEDEFYAKSKALIEQSIDESAKLERSFLIYIQSLLSQCLYPSFLSEVYKASDLYFTQNIKHIDDMNENCQRKIIKDLQLTKELQYNLDISPFLNVSNLSSDDIKYDCSVCKRGDVCAKLHLSGSPYDRKLLREHSKWTLRSNNGELMVCITCLIRIHLYNQVAHHKYHMFLDFLTLTSMTRERSPGKGYYDLIDQQMSNEKWIDELFLSLRLIWARIHQLSMLSSM